LGVIFADGEVTGVKLMIASSAAPLGDAACVFRP
jgi:hypothetical protein